MPSCRTAFALVEVIVALVLLGVGAAALATAIAGERRLLRLAGAESGVARAARERMNALSARACSADTGGRRVEPWGEERWAATPSVGEWTLADTLQFRTRRARVLLVTRLPCLP